MLLSGDVSEGGRAEAVGEGGWRWGEEGRGHLRLGLLVLLYLEGRAYVIHPQPLAGRERGSTVL